MAYRIEGGELSDQLSFFVSYDLNIFHLRGTVKQEETFNDGFISS